MARSVRYIQQLSGNKTDMIYPAGHVHYLFDFHTYIAGTVGLGEVVLFAKMPAGRLIVLPHLSRLNSSAGAAGALLDIGYADYINAEGDLVVGDPDYFILGAAASAAIDTTWSGVTGVTAAGGQPSEFVTADGFQLTATARVGAMDVGDRVILHCAYVLNR